MKLLIGSANSGKTQCVLKRLAQGVSEKQTGMWLVIPSLAAANVLREQLNSSLAQHAITWPKFAPISFPNLFEKVLRFTGPQRLPLSTLERNRLLRSVVAGLAQENRLTYFDRIADKAGLIDTLLSFIDELWRSNTTAEDFARLAGKPSNKDRDIALIFGRYELALKTAGALDAEGAGVYAVRGLERLLRDAEANQPLLQMIKNEFALIACDGFDFYTPTQIRLLQLLSECGVETMATLTYEADRAVHLWQKRTLERFDKARAETLSCAAKSEMAQVATRFMRDEATAENNGVSAQKIKIISAPDRAAEVRAVAREIKRLVIEKRVALADITVVCRTLSTYAHCLERIFDECAIPLALDNQLQLGENPCVIALLQLLNLEANNFQRRAVIDSLRSSYFDFKQFDLNDTNIDLLDKLSLDTHVAQGRAQWLEAIESPARVQSDEPASVAAIDLRLRSGLGEKLNKFFNAVTFSATDSKRNFARRIQELIVNLQVEENLKKGETITTDVPALQKFLELLQMLAKADELAIDGLSQSMVAEVSWETFMGELRRATASTSLARPKALKSSVLIQEAHNLRPRPYRAIFVIGLIEGEFPKKNTETLPYTLAEREMLRKAGIDLAETTNDAGADLTQFHKALTRVAEGLYLSYARTDFAGGELLKSYLLDEVRAVAPVEVLRIAQVETPGATQMCDAASLEELALMTARAMRERNLDAAAVNGPTSSRIPRAQTNLPEIGTLQGTILESSSLLTAQLKSWATTCRAAAVETRRLQGHERGNFGGFIVDEKLAAAIQQRFGEDYLWSASKINDYGLCPFRFFARNVLKLSERREPAESLAADRLGIAYHNILERAYRALKEQGIELRENSLDQATAIIEQVSETVLGEMLEKREIRQSALWEFEKSEIKKSVTNLFRAELEWNAETSAMPVAFEQKFGMAGKPPLVLASLSGKIKIRGQIDRIDERDGELTVIDYKTARTPVSARDAESGRNLQLPIYLMAADRVMMRNKPVAAGYYLHITSCKKGSQFPSRNLSLDDLTAQAERYIDDYVSRARRAEFPIQPNQNRCPPCEFETMCRIQSLGTSADDE
jgi:ATP-dependent helicase/DNAse subunit B